MAPNQQVRVSARNETEVQQRVGALNHLVGRARKQNHGLGDGVFQGTHDGFSFSFAHQASAHEHICGLASLDGVDQVKPPISSRGAFRIDQHGEPFLAQQHVLPQAVVPSAEFSHHRGR